jgi:hypothetical protein
MTTIFPINIASIQNRTDGHRQQNRMGPNCRISSLCYPPCVMAMLFSCDYVNDKYIHLFYAFCCIVVNKLGEGYIVMDILHYTESIWPWHWPWSKTNIWKFPLYPSFSYEHFTSQHVERKFNF